jgi:hypothetical protein
MIVIPLSEFFLESQCDDEVVLARGIRSNHPELSVMILKELMYSCMMMVEVSNVGTHYPITKI